MAKLLETFRSSIIDSIKGRKMGLDNAGYLVGVPDNAVQVEDITSTASTTLAAYGITRILTSGSSQGPVQHTLPAPVVGVQKRIVLNTTSTGSYQFLSTAAGASILSASDGTTKALINFLGQGGAVTLVGLTTAIWAVVSQSGSTGVANISYTTST